MSQIIRSLKPLLAGVVALAATVPLTAVAQDSAAREPGEPYVAEVFTDWELRCITASEEGLAERCEMFQLLLDAQDNPVAVFRVSVPLEPAEDQVAAAVIVTPLETLLTPGIGLRIDENEPVAVRFTLCETTGCLARIPLTEEAITAFRAGGDVFLEIFALVRNDTGEVGGLSVPLTASLRGFTAAYNALQESHVGFAALVAEVRAANAASAEEAEGEAPSE